VVRGIARVLFLKVCLQDVDDLSRVCGKFLGGRVSDRIEVRFVFGVGLET